MTRKKSETRREPLKSFRNLMTFRLHRVANASQRFSEEYYRKLSGLSLVECRVIGIMSELGTSPFKQVCETARLDKSFGSRVVQRLADAAIIAKDENPSDQRSVMLRLTDKGARLHNELYAAGRVLNQEMMSALSEEQMRTLQACLLLISDKLEEMEERGFEPGSRAGAPAAVTETADAAGAGVEMRLDQDTAQKLYRMLGRMLSDKG
jgi:DNA-binding MarR family transcriptional regulator